jgi:hypothetical protein
MLITYISLTHNTIILILTRAGYNFLLEKRQNE